MDIKPIETCYNGYRFRSRLEARWAVFMDALGIKYEYEPEGFELPSGWYLPDFWLPESRVWLEIKPRDGVSDKAFSFAKELCEGTKHPVLISNGLIEPDKSIYEHHLIFFAFVKRESLLSFKEYEFLETLEDILYDIEKENRNTKLYSLRKILKQQKSDYEIFYTPRITQGLCSIEAPEYAEYGDLIFKINPGISVYNKITKYTDTGPFFDGMEESTFDPSPGRGASEICFTSTDSYVSKDIARALQEAKSARFEHGETPSSVVSARSSYTSARRRGRAG